jgi:hypothetical protein
MIVTHPAWNQTAFSHVLLDAGRTVYDRTTGTLVFLAGPHQVMDGDTSGLCAAFT